jgi:ATP/maltotriose-dependent transcriptional regulator MalT
VFDSSFKRLDARQKDVFLMLSVFRGGFDLAAAQAVAGADMGDLISLAEKSMLTRNPESGRYEIHGVLRQYAREALAASGEREHVLDAHSAYYRDFVHAQEARIMSGAQTGALDDIHADFDNIRQAWSRIAEQRDFQSARRMLPGLYAYCDMRSLFYEGEAIFRHGAEGLAPRAGEHPEGAWALVLLSWFDMHNYFEHLGSYDQITSQAQTCLEHARAIKDGLGIAASLVLLGAIAIHRDEFKPAIACYQEAIRIYPGISDFYWVDMRVGLAYQSAGCYDEALEAFDECLHRGRRTGERVKTGWSLQNTGDTLYYQGKYAEAEAPLQQAMALFQEVGTRDGVLWSTYFQSRLALAQGKLKRAGELALAADALAREIHSASWIRTTEELLRELDPGPTPTPQTAAPAGQPPDGAFSQRELEVLQLLKSDLSGPEIAERLVVSVNTVRFHTKHIYQKLGVNSRLEAITRANELGL